MKRTCSKYIYKLPRKSFRYKLMKEDSYNPADIGKKAQAYWERNKSFEVEPDSKKENTTAGIVLSFRRITYGACKELYNWRCNF